MAVLLSGRGLVLADIIEHVSGAYEYFMGIDPEQSRTLIVNTMVAELSICVPHMAAL